MGNITVCFYRGSELNPVDVGVRFDTQRKNQAWEDVPCHCALVINSTLYEFISTGWHSRPSIDTDFIWSKTLSNLDTFLALQTVQSLRNSPYSFWTIFLILVSWLVPDRWEKYSRKINKRICSWFVKTTLEKAGWPCPLWLRKQYVPECPNDIWYAVQET